MLGDLPLVKTQHFKVVAELIANVQISLSKVFLIILNSKLKLLLIKLCLFYQKNVRFCTPLSLSVACVLLHVIVLFPKIFAY